MGKGKDQGMRTALELSPKSSEEPPLKAGDDWSEIIKLLDLGYKRVRTQKLKDGLSYNFTHPVSGAKLKARVKWNNYRQENGKAIPLIAELEYQPGREDFKRTRAIGRPPRNINEAFNDILGRCDELGERFGAETKATGVSFSSRMKNMDGLWLWSGQLQFAKGIKSALEPVWRNPKVERLAVSNQKKAYEAMRVLSHEVCHSVNPITNEQYRGIGAVLEEVLTEECAGSLAHEWIEEHNLGVLIKWAENNPKDPSVIGSYSRYRLAFREMITEAGLSPEETRELIFRMKFKMPHTQRLVYLSNLLSLAKGTKPTEELKQVKRALSKVPRAQRYIFTKDYEPMLKL